MRFRYESEGWDRWNSLVWGVGLVALGVFFMLHFAGRFDWPMDHAWWPLVLVAIGFLQVLTARSARKLGGGVTLMGIGAWLLVAANGWYDLRFYNSWPLALVAVGLGSIVRVLVAPLMPARRDHGCVEVEDDERS
jgi:hypothetical protein